MNIEAAAHTLETSLHRDRRFKHLRVKTRGQALTIISGNPDDIWPHARLSRKNSSRDGWRLSFPNRRGRWEQTPFVGSLADLTALLTRDFAFHLHDFGSS